MKKVTQKEYKVQIMNPFGHFETIKTFYSEDEAWDFIDSRAAVCGDKVYDQLVVETEVD